MSKRGEDISILKSLSNAAFMTYCLGIINCSGLVMAMTLYHAGVDYISTKTL